MKILEIVHLAGTVHCDIRPSNIRMENGTLKLLDCNTALPEGSVLDIIGDTEVSAPEVLNFDPVSHGIDMWAVAVLAYTLTSGISPFFQENENSLIRAVSTAVQYSFGDEDIDNFSSDLKDFIKKCLLRIPEMRMTTSKALERKFLTSNEGSSICLERQDFMGETSDRMLSEESEAYVEGSFVFRTFHEDEQYDSPAESDEDDE